MTHGSLFSGIGGFDLAAEWMGWQNIFHCEINEFGSKVLKYYWPNAISYKDITTTDFTIHRGAIDILTGGFPCQPFSHAGKREGTNDTRHLWPEMLRAIREIQPTYIVGENVYGFVNWNGGMVFDQVQSDLENEGYKIAPVILPACGIGAPHKRDRVWIVSYGANARAKNMPRQEIYTNESKSITDTTSEQGQWMQFNEPQNCEQEQRQLGRGCGKMGNFNASNSGNKRLQRSKKQRSLGEGRKNTNEQPSRFFQPSWQNFPTQSPICSRDDGFSGELAGITFSKHRNESIKAYGNAIVPQVAFEIFKAIELTESKIRN